MHHHRGATAFNRRSFLRQATTVAAAMAAAGCGERLGSNPKQHAPVILLVLDTVRARSCGAWGYHRNTTPRLDAFAAGATRYVNAIAPAPWTLPTHVSLFTGAYTMAHGVRGYVHTDESGQRRIRENALADEARTVAEVFYKKGFETAAFSANTGYMAPYFNLSQGFETYHLERIPGVALVDMALSWVEARNGPFFLFCNVMDAHRPYNLDPCPDTLPEPVSDDLELLDLLREKTLANPDSVDQALAAKVSGQYDRGIANADKALGHLLDGLKRLGRYDQALIVVCADHGEYLGEHGLVEHSKDVFQETVHVPLVVKMPGQVAVNQVERPVSLTQVAPTLLADLDVKTEAHVPSLWEQDAAYPILSENYYSRDWDFNDARWEGRFDRIRTACFDGPWKLIHSSDGDHALFNLKTDPREQDNQYESDPDRANALRRVLDAARKRFAPEPTTAGKPTKPLEPDDKARLRALGYLE